MKPLMTFCAMAHNEPTHNRLFIDSMLSQTNRNWQAIVFHNGPNEELPKLLTDPRFTYMQSEEDTGQWGTINRQWCIDNCDTKYIIQTSVQDYWLPQAVEMMHKALVQDPDIVLWNSINHLVGPCRVLEAELAWSRVDWGNFAIRAGIAKRIGIQHGTQFTADWLFIKDCIEEQLLRKIIRQPFVYTIHN